MPISPELLSILCCPRTKTPVEPLAADRLARLNAGVAAGGIRYADGAPVEQPLAEGLVTVDGGTVYRVDEDIPVMLVDRAIPTDQVPDW